MAKKTKDINALIQFYTDTLAAVGVVPDSSGLLSMQMMGSSLPIEIQEKRLTLPTREVIRTGNWDDYIAFHPLSENYYRGESEVIRKLRNIVNVRLSTALIEQLTTLVGLAANKEIKLPPKQGKLLELIPKADKNMVDNFNKVLNKVSTVGQNKLVNIYLKRKGNLNGKSYPRVAVVSFDFVNEIDMEKRTIFGVGVRKMDIVAFTTLMQFIIPDYEEDHKYSYGTSSQEAPYFDALMNAFANVAVELNKKFKTYKNFFEKDSYIPLGFRDEFDSLYEYKDIVPSLDGNDGELSIDDQKSGNTGNTDNQQAGGNLLNEASADRYDKKQPATMGAPTPPPPQTAPATEQSPWNVPGQSVQQPMAPQQPPTPPPPVPQPVNTGNGLSWNSINQPTPPVMPQYAQPPQYTQPPTTQYAQPPMPAMYQQPAVGMNPADLPPWATETAANQQQGFQQARGQMMPANNMRPGSYPAGNQMTNQNQGFMPNQGYGGGSSI